MGTEQEGTITRGRGGHRPEHSVLGVVGATASPIMKYVCVLNSHQSLEKCY